MRLMDADCGPATRASPLDLFAPDKILYPRSADGIEVLNHAHPVFCLVTIVNVCQQLARKARTVAAVTGPASGPARAILDPAPDAGLRLAALVAPAAGAGVPCSHVSRAQSAVHATGGDQRNPI